MEEYERKASRFWGASTAIAIIGYIVLFFTILYGDISDKQISIIAVLLAIPAIYSLWLLVMFISGSVWGTLSNLNPIVTIIIFIIFPPLLIPFIIGWIALSNDE